MLHFTHNARVGMLHIRLRNYPKHYGSVVILAIDNAHYPITYSVRGRMYVYDKDTRQVSYMDIDGLRPARPDLTSDLALAEITGKKLNDDQLVRKYYARRFRDDYAQEELSNVMHRYLFSKRKWYDCLFRPRQPRLRIA